MKKIVILTKLKLPEKRIKGCVERKAHPPMMKMTTRQITHTIEVKFLNNRYTTAVTIEFGTTDSEDKYCLETS